ncbi:hypothetical protein [uncultured Actinomyces sp.]|uniref:hypothetical protein n=1 Tax=uncultured Actinomyces sp. TaxID=249061 RepID=UPI0026714CFB|nr:hypothetical protein [uncultured Actinomyces sp.]
MLLVGEHEEDGWIQSTFTLTYRVAWEQLLLAVYGAYRYFSDPEVLVDGKPVEIGTPEDVLTIAEDRNIMLRGISTVITAPLMISFYNQVQFVNVSVAAVNDEFRDTDYEKYNKSMGQLMDSMEIMMHLPAPTAEEESAVSDTSAAQEAAPDTDEVSAQAPAGDEPSADEAQPSAEELFASDEDAQERPIAEAQAPAEEEPAEDAQPAVSDTSAAQEAAPDTDEVSAQVPAGDEPPADEAQPANEQVSPLSRLSMELGIPQPPA